MEVVATTVLGESFAAGVASIAIIADTALGSGYAEGKGTPATFVHNENFDITIDLSTGLEGTLLGFLGEVNYPFGKGFVTGIYPNTSGPVLDAAEVFGTGYASGTFVESPVIVADSALGKGFAEGVFKSLYSRLNTVAWSGIGNFNCIPSKENPTAGHAVLPWSGIVWDVRKLGNRVMVYGSGGISKFHPVSEPFSGYGQNLILPFGLACRYAVTGDELVHYFVGSDDNLYSIKPEQQPEKLGYAEYFAAFNSSMIAMFEPESRRAFFSSDTTGTTLVYNPELGLTSLDLLITDIINYEDTLYIIAPSNAENTLPLVTHECVSHIDDLGQRGLKTLTGLSFGIDFEETTNAWAVVYYRYRKNDDFVRFPDVRLNHEGYAHIGVTAIEFMIGIKFTRDSAVLEPVFLDYVQAHVQYGDRRYRRGPISAGGRTNVY